MIPQFMFLFPMQLSHVIFKKTVLKLYNVTGNYYPEIQQFIGTKGIVTWEKAGYSRKDVFAELTDFSINMTKSSFTVDTAKLTLYKLF